MRRKIAAANWKMNLTLKEIQEFTGELLKGLTNASSDKVEIIIAPAYPYLGALRYLLEGNKGVAISGQDVSAEESGAYTGEVSAAMLRDVGCSHVIIGHSERRQYHKEENAFLLRKIRTALKNGLTPIYCVGETLQEREAGKTLEVISQQLSEGAFPLSAEEFNQLVIAYEPVWAIGTGVTATPAQAQEVHAAIRASISKQYGNPVADACRILYGGSVKPDNAKELFSMPDIDGGLVGGASMKAASFLEIIAAG